MNPILCTDSYKLTHWKQYPPGTEYIHSYLEARGGDYAHQVFFGLQYVINTFLNVRMHSLDLREAEEVCAEHFGRTDLFNRAGFERILFHHQGFWPVRVRAVPEGTNVPIHNVLLTIENTDPELPWVTNFLETKLVQLWYPITVATISQHCRRIILRHLRRTGDPLGIDFKLHDFGFRGVSSQESAMIGGMAHLVNFGGTDTLPPLLGAREHYGFKMAGYSIPASEHSTITSWGREGEADAMANMLDKYPDGSVACVSDSYDIEHACAEIWGTQLRDRVLSRKGQLIIRPDSGNPAEVVLKCLRILADKFPSTVNDKGYRVLHPNVRLIQGDGVDPKSIDWILTMMEVNGFSADNIAFGMGGALLQKLNRDTCQMAMKCSAATVNGQDRVVYKDPVTDDTKRSRRGRLTLYKQRDGTLCTSTLPSEGGKAPTWTDAMRIAYEHNRDYRYIALPDTMDVIRARAAEGE